MYRDWPNRTICDVLKGMRKADETKNYSHLRGLIEEAQVYADRMEASLYDQKDIYEGQEKKSKMKKEIRALQKEIKALEEERDKKRNDQGLPPIEMRKDDEIF